MRDFSNNDNTIVIVYPNDSNGAFSHVPEMAERLREAGTNVVVIGDGKTVLTLDEIKKQMEAVEGPASLYIAAHGSDEILVLDNRFGGINGGGAFSYLTSTIDGSDLFKIVPDNFNSVYISSCYAEGFSEDALKHLPKGTMFFPFSAEDTPGISTIYSKFFRSHKAGSMVDGTNPVSAAEHFFHNLAINNVPSRTTEAYKAMGLEPNKFSDVSSINFPKTIGIAGIGIINLKEELLQLDNDHIHDDYIQGFLHDFDKVVQQRTHHVIIQDGEGIPVIWKLGIDPKTGEYSQEQALKDMRAIIEDVENGTLTPDDPHYVIAHAFAFYNSDEAKEARTLGTTEYVANRKLMTIDEVFQEQIGPGCEDFLPATQLYGMAIDGGACKVGEPHIVKVDDQYYLVRSRKDGSGVQVSPLDDKDTVDMTSESNIDKKHSASLGMESKPTDNSFTLPDGTVVPMNDAPMPFDESPSYGGTDNGMTPNLNMDDLITIEDLDDLAPLVDDNGYEKGVNGPYTTLVGGTPKGEPKVDFDKGITVGDKSMPEAFAQIANPDPEDIKLVNAKILPPENQIIPPIPAANNSEYSAQSYG